MNEITTLFTAIGDFFTTSNLFSMVKWPFWMLLFTVAAGGVYCARYGKRTLFNLGIGGALNLMVIYLGVSVACIHIPFLRGLFPALPFLSVTDQGISLVNPFILDLGALAPPLLRLMILIFLVNLAESFRFATKNLAGWLLSQLATVLITLVLYAVIIAGISLLLPALLGLYAIIPVVALIATGILMLSLKIIFTVILNSSNSFVSGICRFFTANKVGSLMTASGMTLLLSIVVLCVLCVTGKTARFYADANFIGLWIILAMLLAVLYIFCMFFCADRKKS